MTVMEPPVMVVDLVISVLLRNSIAFSSLFQNSGYPQGRIVRRARIPKDPFRNIHYTWKDLNIGIDLDIFGIKYHVTDCDRFTRVIRCGAALGSGLKLILFDIFRNF